MYLRKCLGLAFAPHFLACIVPMALLSTFKSTRIRTFTIPEPLSHTSAETSPSSAIVGVFFFCHSLALFVPPDNAPFSSTPCRRLLSTCSSRKIPLSNFVCFVYEDFSFEQAKRQEGGVCVYLPYSARAPPQRLWEESKTSSYKRDKNN